MTKLRRDDDPRSASNDRRMASLMQDADKRIEATVRRVLDDPKVQSAREELRGTTMPKRRGAA